MITALLALARRLGLLPQPSPTPPARPVDLNTLLKAAYGSEDLQ